MTPRTINNSGNAVAMAFVIFINWLIAHLATDWVMPPEVQSAVQALLVACVTEWAERVRRKADLAQQKIQAVLASPDPTMQGTSP